MLMLPQRWQVGLTLSHLTFAREQASQDALIFLGFVWPFGPVGTMVFEGRASMLSIRGDGENWGVYIWGTVCNIWSSCLDGWIEEVLSLEQ